MDEDCKQVVDELQEIKSTVAGVQRAMEATIDAFTRRQNELYDKMDLTLALVQARTDDSFAQLQARTHDAFVQLEAARRDAFTQLKAAMREVFTRLEVAMRIPPDKEEPPRWQ